MGLGFFGFKFPSSLPWQIPEMFFPLTLIPQEGDVPGYRTNSPSLTDSALTTPFLLHPNRHVRSEPLL